MSAVPRVVSLGVLLTLIAILGLSFFEVVAPFLLPLFLAAVVAMISQPLFRYFQKKLRGHVRLAAGVTTVALVAAVLVPVSLAVFLASVRVYAISQTVLDKGQLDRLAAQIRSRLDRDVLFRQLQPFLLADESVKDPQERLALQRQQFERYLEQAQQEFSHLLRLLVPVAAQTVGTTVNVVASLAAQIIALGVFLMALYYFLADGPRLLEAAENLLPVDTRYQRELAGEFAKAVRAVVVATFGAAVTQGAATSALFWAIGRAVGEPALCHPVFFWLLATLAALIPLAGTSLVWVPCAVWLALIGHGWAALTLAILAATVVGLLDNLVRVVVLKSDAQLHPLLALVSVLGGLRVLGMWGVFIGPIVACTLYGLVKIFNEQLRELSHERFLGLAGPEQPASPDAKLQQTLASTTQHGEVETTTTGQPQQQASSHRSATATPPQETNHLPVEPDSAAADLAQAQLSQDPAVNAQHKPADLTRPQRSGGKESEDQSPKTDRAASDN